MNQEVPVVEWRSGAETMRMPWEILRETHGGSNAGGQIKENIKNKYRVVYRIRRIDSYTGVLNKLRIGASQRGVRGELADNKESDQHRKN